MAYLAIFALVSLIPDYVVRWAFNEWQPSWRDYSGRREQPTFHAKLAEYEEIADEFDLVFVGDSRTFCGIAPLVVDPIAGTRSFNLSMMGNWLPTQYPSLKRILESTPPGTTAVWSIGHQNFQLVRDEFNKIYPIGWRNLPMYLSWGYAYRAMLPNLLDGTPGLKVYSRRAEIRQRLEGFLRLPAFSGADDSKSEEPVSDFALRFPVVTDPDVAERELRAEGHVVGLETIRRRGGIVGIGFVMDRGNYELVKIRPDYFRSKQLEMAAELLPLEGSLVPDPGFWENFIAILDLFERHPVHLIVNEIEEAPFNYADPSRRRHFAAFMRRVRAEVERRGVPYIRADLESLTDADYFDYNHLDSRGIPKYSAMLGELLAPLVRSDL